MARKIYDPNDDENSTPSDSELQIQSRELYTNFVREEIELQGLPVPDVPVLVSPDFFKRFFSFFY
jgi:hypothetical protein